MLGHFWWSCSLRHIGILIYWDPSLPRSLSWLPDNPNLSKDAEDKILSLATHQQTHPDPPYIYMYAYYCAIWTSFFRKNDICHVEGFSGKWCHLRYIRFSGKMISFRNLITWSILIQMISDFKSMLRNTSILCFLFFSFSFSGIKIPFTGKVKIVFSDRASSNTVEQDCGIIR